MNGQQNIKKINNNFMIPDDLQVITIGRNKLPYEYN